MKKSSFIPENLTIKTESTLDDMVYWKLAAAVVLAVTLATLGYFLVKKIAS